MAFEIREWISDFTTLYLARDYLPLLELKLIHVSSRSCELWDALLSWISGRKTTVILPQLQCILFKFVDALFAICRKNYAHSLCFLSFCCGKVSFDFTHILKTISLVLMRSYEFPGATTKSKTTVRCRYNAVNFQQNSHNRHPITRPWGRGMGCLLWVESLVKFCPSRCSAVYNTVFY